MSDDELERFMEEVMNEPAEPVAPEEEARWLAFIRAEFVRRGATPLPSWRSIALLVACVSVVLTLGLGPAFSLPFVIVTVTSASAYGGLVRVLAGWPVWEGSR